MSNAAVQAITQRAPGFRAEIEAVLPDAYLAAGLRLALMAVFLRFR